MLARSALPLVATAALLAACTDPPVAPQPTAPAAAAPAALDPRDVSAAGIPLPGGVTSFFPRAINELGWIVGEARVGTAPRGLLYENETGRWFDFGELRGPGALVQGINNAGEVAVTEGAGSAAPNAFVWRQGARIPLPPLPGDVGAQAADINDGGLVVGVSLGAGSPARRTPVVWRGGVPAALPTPAGGLASAADVNNAGQIAGQSGGRPVLWQDEVIRDLGTLGGPAGFAWQVNERGDVAGVSRPSPEIPNHAFLWQAGLMTDLGTIGGEFTSSGAFAVNGFGQAVGSNTELVPPALDSRATLWHEGATTLLPALPGYEQSIAQDINDRGQVVGVSYNHGPAGPVSVPTVWTVRVPAGNEPPTVAGLRTEPAGGTVAAGQKGCGGRFSACLRFRVEDEDGAGDAPFRVLVNWGDGSVWAPNSVPAGTPLLAPHDYAAPGLYRATVTVVDRRGITGVEQTELFVVEGPEVPACTGDVSIQVSAGTEPTFSWAPACRLSLVLVEPADSGRDLWAVGARRANRIAPGVRYGVVPPGVSQTTDGPPVPLVAGQSYKIVLGRAGDDGGTVLAGLSTFTP